MKRILIISLVLALALMALIPMTAVWGDTTDTVACTVTGSNLSVSITSDGTVNYGTLSTSASQDTTSGGLDDTQTANNDGTIAAKFNITSTVASGGSTDWTLGETPGTDVFVHSFSTDSGSSWEPISTAGVYETLAASVAVDGNQTFDLKITMPSTISDYDTNSITVTIQAVTP